MVLRPCGTANARAILNAQLDAWWKETMIDDRKLRTVASDTAFSGFPSQRVL